MENFRNTIKEIESANYVLEELKKVAIDLGMSKSGANTFNIGSFCLKALRNYAEILQVADELGISPLNSLKSFRIRNKKSELVPVEMKFAPPHWVCDTSVETVKVRKNSKIVEKVFKTRSVSAATAQRLRTGLQPQIADLFALINDQDWRQEDKDECRNQIVESYKTESYQKFSEMIIDALWRLNVGEDSPESE